MQFGSLGVPDFNPGVRVPEVVQDSPAEMAGLQAGDVIIAANNQTLGSGDPVQRELIQIIQSSPETPVSLTLQRDHQELEVLVTPQLSPTTGDAIIGVGLQPNVVLNADGSVAFRSAKNPVELLSVAAYEFQSKTKLVAGGMIALLTNFSSMADQVGSPVKIVEQGAGLAKADFRTLFPFAAIISINLAIINILPLPALDGGQLAFLLFEALFGRPLPMRFQESVMKTGIVFLLGLGIILIARDITQLEVLQNLRQ